jgi:nucleotide-binding universal stress UspA family protein
VAEPPVPPLRRVLVAVDGSEAAAGALALAFALHRVYGSALILCNAVDHAAAMVAAAPPDGALLGMDAVLQEYDDAGKALLSDASARAAAAGVPVSTVLLEGHPAAAIADGAKRAAVDAIVLGTHGRRGLGHVLLGSTAEGVLRLATVPAFVVHLPHDAAGNAVAAVPPSFERILVAIDDSDPSDAALTFALELAAANDARVFACSVVESGELFDQAVSFGYEPTPLLAEMHETAGEMVGAKVAAGKRRGLTIEPLIVEGKVDESILESARAKRADLIVMGTHGRRGLRRLFVGSVAESVVRAAAVPVAVVRTA